MKAGVCSWRFSVRRPSSADDRGVKPKANNEKDEKLFGWLFFCVRTRTALLVGKKKKFEEEESEQIPRFHRHDEGGLERER